VIDCDRRDYSTIDRDHDRDRAQPYCQGRYSYSKVQNLLTLSVLMEIYAT